MTGSRSSQFPASFLPVVLLLVLFVVGCQSLHGVYHTVEEGQTLYRISRVYGVDEATLARINRISDPRALPVGKQLFIPGAAEVLPVPATAVQVVPTPSPPQLSPAPTVGVTRLPARPSTQPSARTSTGATPAARSPARSGGSTAATPQPQKGMFAWPLQGKVLRCFSEGGKDPCKGIEIAARSGTPVKAAAAGNVIYSGSGIRGYGNLIIIKHQDSYFTVYGYNSSNLVKSGAYVSKGEKIALSGSPPSGGAARLHFEVRYGKKSMDPALYLP